MNKSNQIKKRIKQKLKSLKHKQKEKSVFLVLAIISLIITFGILVICFLAENITIIDILSIVLSIVGFILSVTTYISEKKENLDFQIDFYTFILYQIEERQKNKTKHKN